MNNIKDVCNYPETKILYFKINNIDFTYNGKYSELEMEQETDYDGTITNFFSLELLKSIVELIEKTEKEWNK